MKALFSRKKYAALVILHTPVDKSLCVFTELDWEMAPTDEALELMNARVIAWAERRRDERGHDFQLFLPVHLVRPHWRSGSRQVWIWGTCSEEIAG